MINTVKRFYQEKNSYYVEIITYVLAGTNGVELDDPRCRPIGQEINDLDNWLVLSISNPAYVIPELPYNYRDETMIDPLTLEPITVQIKTTPILGDEFFNSPYWTPYDNPLRKGVKLISESEYWAKTSKEAKDKQRKRKTSFDKLNLGQIKTND